jgi:serine/threonine protein phosphatase PrpC
MPDNQPIIEWGVATQALAGHEESGDQYVVQPFENGVLTAVIDGLGHGDRAAVVAKSAMNIIKTHAHEPVVALMKRCHENLRGSRGAVISMASFNVVNQTMTWLGIGNVNGVLLHVNSAAAPAHKSLLLRGGVVGYRMPTLRDNVLPVKRGDLLFFVTDGIRSGFIKEQIQDPFSRTLDKNDSPQKLADFILARYSRGTDDTLVLVARYNGKPTSTSS